MSNLLGAVLHNFPGYKPVVEMILPVSTSSSVVGTVSYGVFVTGAVVCITSGPEEQETELIKIVIRQRTDKIRFI